MSPKLDWIVLCLTEDIGEKFRLKFVWLRKGNILPANPPTPTWARFGFDGTICCCAKGHHALHTWVCSRELTMKHDPSILLKGQSWPFEIVWKSTKNVIKLWNEDIQAIKLITFNTAYLLNHSLTLQFAPPQECCRGRSLPFLSDQLAAPAFLDRPKGIHSGEAPKRPVFSERILRCPGLMWKLNPRFDL